MMFVSFDESWLPAQEYIGEAPGVFRASRPVFSLADIPSMGKVSNIFTVIFGV